MGLIQIEPIEFMEQDETGPMVDRIGLGFCQTYLNLNPLSSLISDLRLIRLVLKNNKTENKKL